METGGQVAGFIENAVAGAGPDLYTSFTEVIK